MKRDPRITINLDREDRKKLEVVAAANGRYVSQEARFAITRHIEAELAAAKGRL